MNLIYLSVGVVLGIVVTNFFTSKKQTVEKLNSNEIDEKSQTENRKLKEELSQTLIEMETLKADMRKIIKERDSFEDNADDAEFALNKLKNINSKLVSEIEKMKIELNEFEMLYNARKEEIMELKRQGK